jgi:NhaP-type Na+/H+ or K+/H+ antiporter
MSTGAALVAALIALYAALALRLARWWISMPMVFVGAGMALGQGGMGLLALSPDTEGVKALTELTLALVLFADASTLHLRRVREDISLPARLLTIGLVLSIAGGTIVALGVLPVEDVAMAALLGAILAPTDAALGLPIFANRHVPVRIRQALNVESGLNDGIVTPFVALFLAAAVATEEHATSHWLATALAEIGIATVVGAAIGVAGGALLLTATDRGWTSGGSQQIATLGLGLTAYFTSVTLHGNGFLAAFIGGSVFGAVTRYRFVEPTEFTETFSTVLALLVWVLFGAALVPRALAGTSDWRPIVYAMLSLTTVRMLPVALALTGTRLRADTVALMGWFGPRGLASVVFTLTALLQLDRVGQPIDTLVVAATWTILLSVVLHGLSAQPLSEWYARRLELHASSGAEEFLSLSEPHRRRRALMHHGKP